MNQMCEDCRLMITVCLVRQFSSTVQLVAGGGVYDCTTFKVVILNKISLIDFD